MGQATVSFSAQGTELYVKIPGQGYKIINQIQKLSGPDITDTIADVSCLSSPGGFKEKKPLMKDPTPVTFDMVTNPADTVYQYLRNSKATYPAPLEDFLEISSDPNQETVKFSGFVTKFGRTRDTNTVGMTPVEITPTGAPSFYFGVSPA